MKMFQSPSSKVLLFICVFQFINGCALEIVDTGFPANLSLTCISVNNTGTQANNGSVNPAINYDGRFVLFTSLASNLVEDDTNGCFDIFLYDRLNNIIRRVSINSEGDQGNDHSAEQSDINSDGKFVVFESDASNLVLDDTNGVKDILVADLNMNQIERVSVSTLGEEGNDSSLFPSISSDGRYVLFISSASNLVLNDTNNNVDVFLHDRQSTSTIRISENPSGVQANGESMAGTISDNGRYVAFSSGADNLVLDDTNGKWDVFVKDLLLNEIKIVSKSTLGELGNNDSGNNYTSISSDGRYITFASSATNLVQDDTNGVDDIFFHDCQTGITKRISINNEGQEADAGSFDPEISSNGRYIIFESYAGNLSDNATYGNNDIYFYDRVLNTLRSIYIHAGSSLNSVVSGNGNYTAFSSSLESIVPDDINGVEDIFVAPAP